MDGFVNGVGCLEMSVPLRILAMAIWACSRDERSRADARRLHRWGHNGSPRERDRRDFHRAVLLPLTTAEGRRRIIKDWSEHDGNFTTAVLLPITWI